MNDLLKLGGGKITIPSIGVKEANASLMKKSGKGFKIECELQTKAEIGEPYDAIVSFKSGKYYLKQLMFNEESLIVNGEPKGARYMYAGTIHAIFSRKQKQNAVFHRTILPIPRSAELFRFFDTTGFRNETHRFNHSLVEVVIQKRNYHLHELDEEGNSFIIIDGLKKEGFKEFFHNSYLILVAYGFVTSRFYQNEAFFLTSTSETFAKIDSIFYYELMDSLISVYELVYANAYSFLGKNTELAKKIQPTLKTLSSQVLNKLLERLAGNRDFLLSILTILEGNTTSLVLRPACYSVALERLNK
jgi:hypothetical protein